MSYNGPLHHIVFVCKGNIYRSAFAEYYLKSISHGGILTVESCGLDVDQGIFSPPGAVQIGREFGVDLSMHHSKGLATCNLPKADLILPMEYQQFLRLTALFPEYQGKIRLLRDFAPWPIRLMCNIYDPYGLEEVEIRRCFLLIKKALSGLRKHLSISNTQK